MSAPPQHLVLPTIHATRTLRTASLVERGIPTWGELFDTPPALHEEPSIAAAQDALLNIDDVGGPQAWERLLRDHEIREILPGYGCAFEVNPTQTQRAQAYGNLAGPNAIACASTALWIYLGGTPPRQLYAYYQNYTPKPMRSRLVKAKMRLIYATEINEQASVRLTSPGRTFVDVLPENKAGFEPADISLLATFVRHPEYGPAIANALKTVPVARASNLPLTELRTRYEELRSTRTPQ